MAVESKPGRKTSQGRESKSEKFPAVRTLSDDAGKAPPRSDPRPGPRTVRPLILLPTLNEEAGLAATLTELDGVTGFPGGQRPDLLVVDGHSDDGTLRVAAQSHALVLMQTGRGKGRAIREGLAFALANGYTSVGVLDADGTYPGDRLPAVFDLLESEADVVAGVRRPTEPPSVTARNLVHRVGNGILNVCAAQLSHGPILDVCTGFWGVRSSVIDLLQLESDGFEVESELFVKSVRRRLRIVQIPIDYRPRIGEAKLHAIRDGSRILRSIVRHSLASMTAAPMPERPRKVPVRTPALVRNLTTVLYAFQADSIVIASGSARRSEAMLVATSLRQYRPDVAVTTEVAEPAGSLSSATRSEGRDAGGSEGRLLRVSLPGTEDGVPPGSAFVSVIPAGRTILVQSKPEVGTSAAPDSPMAETPLPERSAVRSPGPLRILGATLDPSGIQREIALVAANGSAAPVDLFVLRTPVPASGPPTGFDSVPEGPYREPSTSSLRIAGSR